MDETTTQLDERAFRVAKEDALATFAPRGAIFGSGFIAGFVITWLPMLVYVVIFVWQALFGASLTNTGDTRLQMALGNLLRSWGDFASVAWMYSIVIGGLGVLFAYLRALSCVSDWYLRFDTSNSVIRLGMHQVIGVVGIPVLVGVIVNIFIGDPQAYYILLVPIAISGMLFNLVFQALQTFALRRMYPVDDLDLTLKGLQVFVPRLLGRNHATVSEIRLDRQAKIAEVFGSFDSDASRQEVRQVVAHFLRGYHPIHVRDNDLEPEPEIAS